MSEPEQCIICLDPLPRPSPALVAQAAAIEAASSPEADVAAAAAAADAVSAAANDSGTPDLGPFVPVTAADVILNDEGNDLNILAALDGCEHVIHEACIRAWAQKTNTCPICRNAFHTIRVYNGVDGTAISTYDVEDKKQVAEFDIQQWLGDNPDEEEPVGNPCPICNSADREDILLLCDSCDAAYHTHCIGLEDVPEGDWYCMECAHLFQLDQEPRLPRPPRLTGAHGRNLGRRESRGNQLRTRARLRRARRQARNAAWQGVWGQFSSRFYEMSEVDLDNHDGEDEDLEQWRHLQQSDQRELHRWQQRVDIAHRLGARDAFASTLPPQISERLQSGRAPPLPPAQPVVETVDERRAWGAFDRARESENPSTNGRKRKARSVTASPAEPAPEPERKLKRPRTRRLATQCEPSTAAAAAASGAGLATTSALSTTSGTATAPGSAVGTPPATTTVHRAGPSQNAIPARNGVPGRRGDEPPLVSSLLKELEPSTPTEDESTVATPGRRHQTEASSPALSPAPSNHSSPRAMSLTPPPLPLNGSSRPESPTLSLSTHIQPRYLPANYSPTRYSSDHSDTEAKQAKSGSPRQLELRQPRPRRPHRIPEHREDSSPTRATMTPEEKKSINDIVKNALRPHWRAQKLTTEQYATINRDISRKLYDEVRDASSLDDSSKRSWEVKASQEVAQAIAALQG